VRAAGARRRRRLVEHRGRRAGARGDERAALVGGGRQRQGLTGLAREIEGLGVAAGDCGLVSWACVGLDQYLVVLFI